MRESATVGHLYAIIDACDTPAVPEKAREVGEARAVSLYRGSADEMYSAFAPYLFAVDAELLDWIVADLWPGPWGIFVVAEGDLETVRRHFRRFLLVQSPDGEQWYFRFYDPRVLREFLPHAGQGELRMLFGNVLSLGITSEPPCIVWWTLAAPARRIRVLSPTGRIFSSLPSSGTAVNDRLTIRPALYDHFSESCFEIYLQRLVHRLSEFSVSPYPIGNGAHDDLVPIARRLVAEAEQHGFEAEEDVTAFVLLRASSFWYAQDSGIRDWIDAILNEKEIAAEDRLNAVFEVLPEAERLRIFKPLAP